MFPGHCLSIGVNVFQIVDQVVPLGSPNFGTGKPLIYWFSRSTNVTTEKLEKLEEELGVRHKAPQLIRNRFLPKLRQGFKSNHRS